MAELRISFQVFGQPMQRIEPADANTFNHFWYAKTLMWKKATSVWSWNLFVAQNVELLFPDGLNFTQVHKC